MHYFAEQGQKPERCYAYTSQLLALEKCRPGQARQLPPCLLKITTPLKLDTWREELKFYPDQQFAEYILRGIENGFRIGFRYDRQVLHPCRHNMLSATQAPQVVSNYLEGELALNRIAELTPVQAQKLEGLQCSSFGVIPKKQKPGKWRLIVDLSSPEAFSVNDGISKELCSLTYASVDDVVACVLKAGKGALLAKMDIKSAYRNIPVHPDDRPLLGMRWQDRVFVDKTLPFGLRSAPLIFSAVADVLQWIMQRRGINDLFHYIDDFITVAAPGSSECASNVQIMKSTCTDTGMPIEPDKSEGPATLIPFLGLELDSEAQEVRLPQEKLGQLLTLLQSWRGRKACRKRELLSLIGSLSHACKAVRPGRTFLRRLIDLSTVVKHLDHYVRLSRSARSDIEWWFQFASRWNGTAMMTVVNKANPHCTVTSDASGKWGCGAFCGPCWFQLRWTGPIAESHITVKELVPIVLAAAVWGRLWVGKTILARCDNAAMVAIINQGNSKEPECMHLMRCLSFIAAQFSFNMVASHIKGTENDLADAISRNNLGYFFSRYPQASPIPTALPQELST